MAIMFMRLQEFTEGSKAFRGKILSEGDSLIAYLKKRKKIYYKAGWAGFNISGRTLNKAGNSDEPVWNQYEKDLFREVFNRFASRMDGFKGGQYYVIAYLKGDKATKKHEKIHATFYLNPAYRNMVWEAIEKNGTKKAKKYLKSMDYNFPKTYDGNYHLIDEINAYAMEEKCHKMRKHLGLTNKTYKILKKLHKDYV